MERVSPAESQAPPRMPAGVEIDPAQNARLRDFHLAGGPSDAGPSPPLALAALAALASRLPAGEAMPWAGSSAVVALHAEALAAERGPRRAAQRAETARLAAALEQILVLDRAHGPDARGAAVLASGLGSSAGLIDAEALAGRLPTRGGPARLSAERRGRIARALAVLRQRLAQEDPLGAVLVHGGGSGAGVGAPVASLRVVENREPLEFAMELHDAGVSAAVELARAFRIARLEIEAGYEPELHDMALERLDADALTADELLSIPPVVALESAERLGGPLLGRFSELLRSGRPLHVLVLEQPRELRATDRASGLGAHHSDLGYLIVAHRESFVLQATAADPVALRRGLARMVATTRTAVALVAVPPEEPSPSALARLVAAHLGRVTPCFVHDPGGGSTWSARFDLSGNDSPDRPWSVVHWSHLDSEGVESEFAEPFTAAHFAALDPSCRAHFLVVPPAAWNGELIEVGRWLVAPDEARRRGLPFVWVIDETRTLARAVITRELAEACRDRQQAWRILQELAGTDNEHARRAAEEARRSAREEAAAELASERARFALELEQVRAGTARETIERLVTSLVAGEGWDGATVLPPSAQPAAAAALPPAGALPSPIGPATASIVAPRPTAPARPWIDTAACTSCNDCININSRMFRYDENKQATLADPSAGTFAELVLAAEKCPAHCIHPGAPRPGDTTATPALVARAEPFNG